MSSIDDNIETNPIESFSECHAGIVSHLNELDTLPALLAPAMQARKIAGEAVRFFRSAVFEHHNEEERELFPSVLSNASEGEGRNKVQAIVDRLVREHRHRKEQRHQGVRSCGQSKQRGPHRSSHGNHPA